MTEFPSVDTRELRKRLGVDIDAETFLLSLTHRSYAFENPGVEHNERLEFLGDSVTEERTLPCSISLMHRQLLAVLMRCCEPLPARVA